MNRAPKVGDRVAFPGNGSIGACVGVVERIYVVHEWDEDTETEGPPRPERYWKVSMRPDTLPRPWPYVGHATFVPDVGELKSCERAS